MLKNFELAQMLKFGHFALAQYSQSNSSHTESAQSEDLSLRSQRVGGAAAVVGKHPDLLVGPPTSTVFPTNDQKLKKSQFFEKFFEKI